ncbi:Pre-mRNA-splicing factor Cwf15/Cwc15 [Xylariomycetidae sp. FL2044]|nr:Pre-mRNA-splicing factor Cwf15/Cwc15 [Xylariomycetidae sp. FL2044]
MTTAHRPTFDPARGKEALRGPAYHQRLLPAHTQLKFRQPGQGGDADEPRDLRAELLAAEAAHFAKQNGGSLPPSASSEMTETAAAATFTSSHPKRALENTTSPADAGEDAENPEAKRRRILEESRDIDADSEDDDGDDKDDADSDDSSEDDSDDDDDDEEAELQRELEKIRRERQEKREREERERAAAEEEERERDIALGNPLLNPKQDFNMKRRWNDDVVFKNQARGTEEKGKKKEFINDLLRSDFHKRFMSNLLVSTMERMTYGLGTFATLFGDEVIIEPDAYFP